MTNELIVKNAEGADQTILVVDIVEDNYTGKKYMFYNVPESNELYATILVESETSYVLESINNEEEWSIITEILQNQMKLEGASHE
jgi:uncharacterized protein YrzB (UPF0473 family)